MAWGKSEAGSEEELILQIGAGGGSEEELILQIGANTTVNEDPSNLHMYI